MHEEKASEASGVQTEAQITVNQEGQFAETQRLDQQKVIKDLIELLKEANEKNESSEIGIKKLKAKQSKLIAKIDRLELEAEEP